MPGTYRGSVEGIGKSVVAVAKDGKDKGLSDEMINKIIDRSFDMMCMAIRENKYVLVGEYD